MKTIFTGKKQIISFVGRFWKTIKDWIDNHNFPAKKIDGIWESDSEMITAWRRKRIAGESA